MYYLLVDTGLSWKKTSYVLKLQFSLVGKEGVMVVLPINMVIFAKLWYFYTFFNIHGSILVGWSQFVKWAKRVHSSYGLFILFSDSESKAKVCVSVKSNYTLQHSS